MINTNNPTPLPELNYTEENLPTPYHWYLYGNFIITFHTIDDKTYRVNWNQKGDIVEKNQIFFKPIELPKEDIIKLNGDNAKPQFDYINNNLNDPIHWLYTSSNQVVTYHKKDDNRITVKWDINGNLLNQLIN